MSDSKTPRIFKGIRKANEDWRFAELPKSKFEVLHITRRAALELDQPVWHVALVANTRSTLSWRVKALSQQAAPDCEPKRHKAETQINDRTETLRQSQWRAR